MKSKWHKIVLRIISLIMVMPLYHAKQLFRARKNKL